MSEAPTTKEGNKDVPVSPEHEIYGELVREAVKVVDTYRTVLADQHEDSSVLGAKSKDNLSDTVSQLDELSRRMTEWVDKPASLGLVQVKTDDRKNGSTVTIRLREEESGDLPTSFNDALFQMNIQCTVLQEARISYDDEITARSYEKGGRFQMKSGSAETTLIRAMDNTDNEVEVKIGAQYVYLNPRTESIKYDNGPAVSIVLQKGGGVVCRGLSYIGMTPHRTEPFIQPTIDRPMVEQVRDKIQDPRTVNALRQRSQVENMKRKA